MNKTSIDLDKFKEKFLIENLTIGECANYFGCGKSTIVRFCSKHNIKKPVELRGKNISKKTTKHDHELVSRLYFKDNLTKNEISEKLGMKIGAVSKIIAISKHNKTKEQKKELLYKVKASKKELEYLYINQNKSLKELQDIFNVGETAIIGALKRYGIAKPEELRTKLVIKKFVETGRANLINGKTVLDLANDMGLSATCINKFIRNNDNLSETEKEESLKTIALNSKTSLEETVSKMLKVDFLNKKIKTGYKPDFKIKDGIYLNVDGLYWHSEKVKTDKKYHLNMRKSYEKNNMRILQFREDEIYNKKNIVVSMVNNIINKNIRTIYARKCEIRSIKQKMAISFLNNNHLMGNIKAKHVGLFFDNELVSIFSYKIYKDKLKVERFCSKINTRVVGGFSKLLKSVEKQTNPNKIEYWVDLRYGTGSYLEKIGFSHSHDTLGWKWTDFSNTYNRMFCLAKDGRSERELASEKGLFKIYDAGQRLYIKDYNVQKSI